MSEKYKALFLIISSENEQIYRDFKKYHPKYFNLFKNDIKFFFIESKEDLNEEIIEDGDYLYTKGTESIIPNIYRKTMIAMDYVSKKYNFDFLIRTNLSSFWNLTNLLNLLNNIQPYKFAGGFTCQGFMSGTFMLMSNDVCKKMVDCFIETIYTNPRANTHHDDVFISEQVTSLGIPLYNICQYNWGFLIPFIDPNIKLRYLNIDDKNDDFSDILVFRIKHGMEYEERQKDIYCFNVLFKKIYGLEL
jgi:hypothetical protein